MLPFAILEQNLTLIKDLRQIVLDQAGFRFFAEKRNQATSTKEHPISSFYPLLQGHTN
jgi:hypothetical protein